MVEITGYYVDLTRLIRLIHGQVMETHLWQPLIASVVTQETNDGRATDSCFALIWANQCGVLMINAVCLLENWGGITGGRK